MTHERLLELLIKAQAAAVWQEKFLIFQEFNGALNQKGCRQFGEEKVRLCLECLRRILSTVYWGYLENCPELLITALPLFMILCGDTACDDSLDKLGQADWEFFLSVLSR